MLKIKADRIKDLEMIGFQRGIEGCYNYIVKKNYLVVEININENREIYCNNSELAFDLLYDLIKDDMIEKVVEYEQD